MTATADRASSPRERRGLATTVLRHAGSVLVVLLVTGLLALAAALSVVPKAAGARTLTVLSGSMEPAIPARSIVVVRPVAAEDVRVGDVITFVQRSSTGVRRGGGPGHLVTHRVERVSHGEDGVSFVTRGDANDAADLERVRPANVVGRVWYHVPYVGGVRDGLFATPLGLYSIAALLLVVGVSLLAHAFWGPDDPEGPGGGRPRTAEPGPGAAPPGTRGGPAGPDGAALTAAGRLGRPAEGPEAGPARPLVPRPRRTRTLAVAAVVASASVAVAAAAGGGRAGTAAWLRSTATTPVAELAGDRAPEAAADPSDPSDPSDASGLSVTATPSPSGRGTAPAPGSAERRR